MDVRHINPFINATVGVFQTMLDWTVHRSELKLLEGSKPQHEVSGIIALSGGIVGTVVLSMHRDVALAATETLLMERPDSLNADVLDTIGELTNMVAGNAKAELRQFRATLGLPTVVVGTDHRINFDRKVKPISISFDAVAGPLSLDVGLLAPNAGVQFESA